MRRQVVENERVLYQCFCGRSEPGGKEDRRLRRVEIRAPSQITDRYGLYIRRHAGHDQTLQNVAEDCPNPSCGLDFLGLAVLGDDAQVVRICRCGYNSIDGVPEGNRLLDVEEEEERASGPTDAGPAPEAPEADRDFVRRGRGEAELDPSPEPEESLTAGEGLTSEERAVDSERPTSAPGEDGHP